MALQNARKTHGAKNDVEPRLKSTKYAGDPTTSYRRLLTAKWHGGDRPKTIRLDSRQRIDMLMPFDLLTQLGPFTYHKP
jgi:hypothetical protein